MNSHYLLDAARAAGATVLEGQGATVIVLMRDGENSGDHLTLEDARALGKFKTTRPLKDAARRGELRIYGKQRTRTVKRGELLQWLESQRVEPGAALDDSDITRRMRAIARRGRTP